MVYYDVSDFAHFLTALADKTQRPVVAFDYDKLPEATVEDSVKKLLRTIQEERLRYSDAPDLAGDSVGGLLALYMAAQYASKSYHELFLLYPVVSLNVQYPSHNHYGERFLLNSSTMRWFATMLRAFFNAQKFDPLRLTSAQANRLPPIQLFTAGCDVLHDEAIAFTQHATGLGMTIHHRCFETLPHDFALYLHKVPCAEHAVTDIIQTLTMGEN
jgi:acetyl esterase/lipase